MVAATRSHVAHLKQHGAGDHTLLEEVFHKNRWSSVCITETAKEMWEVAKIIRLQVGFNPEDVNTCSMRACRTMSLLLTIVNENTIRIVGKWHSNAIMRYVHTLEKISTQGLVTCMVQCGDYALIPTVHRG